MAQLIKIQVGDADVVERDDQTASDDRNWRTVAQGKNADEALRSLISAMNHEEVPVDNSWLRIAIYNDKGELLETENF